jgi:transcriptional regulator
MYLPEIFREDRLDILHALMRAHPLATLATAGSGGLLANLAPFLVIEDDSKGTLRAHIAKTNDQVNALREGCEALVIFQGPHAPITPSWYPSKAEHGKVVPTWNYAMVQARGKARVIENPEWIRAQVEALTASQEEHRAKPWHVSDAPEEFIATMLKGIVGIEIPIEHIEGKWKVSQNRPEADRRGVTEGLRREHAGEDMARLVEERIAGAKD